jgi:hypothetical protein
MVAKFIRECRLGGGEERGWRGVSPNWRRERCPRPSLCASHSKLVGPRTLYSRGVCGRAFRCPRRSQPPLPSSFPHYSLSLSPFRSLYAVFYFSLPLLMMAPPPTGGHHTNNDQDEHGGRDRVGSKSKEAGSAAEAAPVLPLDA